MNEIIGKHSFYQVPEKLAELKKKMEELEGTSTIQTEVIGKFPLIARAFEDVERMEEIVAANQESFAENQKKFAAN